MSETTETMTVEQAIIIVLLYMCVDYLNENVLDKAYENILQRAKDRLNDEQNDFLPRLLDFAKGANEKELPF